MNTLELATHGPVIPVIVINRVEDAVPMAEALLEGGIKDFIKAQTGQMGGAAPPVAQRPIPRKGKAS